MNIVNEWYTINEFSNVIPVPVQTIPAALNIELKEAYLDDEISGMIENNSDSFIITINTNDSRVRKRFTIAHELGHYMLHRNLIGIGLDDDRAYRSTKGGKYHNISIGPAEEREANRFAANLLMPVNQVRLYWKKLDLNDLSGSTRKVAELFEVSELAMKIRLKNLNLISNTS